MFPIYTPKRIAPKNYTLPKKQYADELNPDKFVLSTSKNAYYLRTTAKYPYFATSPSQNKPPEVVICPQKIILRP